MKTLFLLTSLLTGTVFPLTASAEPSIGATTISVPSLQRGKPLSVDVWYPTDAAAPDVLVGDNRIFTGVSAKRDAPVKTGHYPLILLSHGSGSRAQGMAWIAARLAEKGFIVAGPDHPGTTSGDSTPIATPRIWERTQDLSNIITWMTGEARWKGSVDAGKIGVLGFSLGGSTALELIGGRADLSAYADYCDRYTMMMDCQWFAGGFGFVDGKRVASPVVKLREFDKAHFEQSNLDPRVMSAVIVDPGLATAFQADSLKQIKVPTTIINLGSPGGVPVAVYSYKLSAEIPGAQYHQIPGSNHFSFLPVCKPDAQDVLSESGDPDPICDGKGLRDRAEVHQDAERLIIDAFDRAFR
ncbi:alpha/beta fold hydrolase [Rhizobium sp. SSA_523]|uniref:alpha/beta hydrolase family protein n=1 Tax=Rhizobium sp. SSA_523 TaxID=2952477 RepID=UPI00209141AF|nr:alpha/beta fold hydrolase [Rhizobium sp. SSA_523]MCO5732765.1 alpha/beta hydrolase [Rhizobium sp. SSA_523]WKC23617.1 alpha/beta hydrolase [Rhizobium sp. SSA_523]